MLCPVETKLVRIVEYIEFWSEKNVFHVIISIRVQVTITLSFWKKYRPHIPNSEHNWRSSNSRGLSSVQYLSFAYSLLHTDENASSQWTTQLLHGGHVAEFPAEALTFATFFWVLVERGRPVDFRFNADPVAVKLVTHNKIVSIWDQINFDLVRDHVYQDWRANRMLVVWQLQMIKVFTMKV